MTTVMPSPLLNDSGLDGARLSPAPDAPCLPATGGAGQAAASGEPVEAPAGDAAGNLADSPLITAGLDADGAAPEDEVEDGPAGVMQDGAGEWSGGLDVDTAVPTPTGWSTVGDLGAGDFVLGPDGRPTQVLAVGEVTLHRPCLRLTFSDGQRLVADADHLWVTEVALDRMDKHQQRRRPRKHRRVGSDADLAAVAAALASDGPPVIAPYTLAQELGWTTSKYLGRIYTWAKDLPPAAAGPGGAPLYQRRALLEHLAQRLQVTWNAHQTPVREPATTAHIADTLIHFGRANHAVLVAEPVDLPEADHLVLHPYLLGCWLGDGTTASSELTTADPQMADRLRSLGYIVTKRTAKYLYAMTLPGATSGPRGPRSRPAVSTLLRELGVLGDKHVPTAYLRASADQRRELLAGLLDTDGTVSPAGGQVQFTSTNHRLATAAHELACSLGYRPTTREGRARLNGRDISPKWEVGFTTTDEVFRLTRKQQALRERCRSDGTRTRVRYITEATPVPSRAVRALRVARPDGLFLTGRSFITTTTGQQPPAAPATPTLTPPTP